MRSREVKGESVGQGQGKGGSDRDNLTDPGEAVTTSEVRGGINSEEEGEKGIRVERMDGQRVGREERRDLFKRETEHLCIRPPIHGIGRDPLTRE